MSRRTAVRVCVVLSAMAVPLGAIAPAVAAMFSGAVAAPTEAYLEGRIDLYPAGYDEGDDIFNASFGNDRVVRADVPAGRYDAHMNAELYGPGDGSTRVYGEMGTRQLFEPTDTLDATVPVVPLEVNLRDTDGEPAVHSYVMYCSGSVRSEDEEDPRLFPWNSYSSGTTEGGTATLYQLVNDDEPDVERPCTLLIEMGDDLPSLVRSVAPGAGSVDITIPDARVELSGTLEWPFSDVGEGYVQVVSANGYPVGTATMSADGSWSTQVWPGTYDINMYVQDSTENADFVQRGVVVSGDTAVDPDVHYTPAKLYVVDGSGQTTFGYLQAACRDDPQGLGSSMSLNRVAKPGEALSLEGIVTTPGWECWFVGHDGYNSWQATDWFTVPAGGTYVWTYDTSTGELTDGAPTTDGDAVSDEVEGQAPNGGDGNGDGTPDDQQANVTSLPANGSGPGGGASYVTVAGPTGTTLSGVSTLDPTTLANPPPAGTQLPAGLVSFKLNVATPGDSKTISIYAGSTAGVTGYAKYDPATETWTMLASDLVQVFTDHVDITLTDGGAGDADGYPNGVITDPGGMAKVVTGDTTAPIVTGRATTRPNAYGWYRGNVRIDWSATDPGSGVRTQPADTVVSAEGTNVIAESPVVCDEAPTPNCTIGTLSGLKIDKTAPSLSVGGVTNGATYTVGSAPTPTCVASDALSGLAAACKGVLVGGNRNKVGQFVYAATVADKAGNSRVVTATYRVTYRVDGFLQPVNDPALDPGAPLSVFRAGSTVAAALTLKQSNGQVVTPVTPPVWLPPQKGARTSSPVNESVSNAAGTSGTTLVWKNNRWQYDWSTKKVTAGYVYKLGVRLDDGTTRYVNVAVR